MNTEDYNRFLSRSSKVRTTAGDLCVYLKELFIQIIHRCKRDLTRVIERSSCLYPLGIFPFSGGDVYPEKSCMRLAVMATCVPTARSWITAGSVVS